MKTKSVVFVLLSLWWSLSAAEFSSDSCRRARGCKCLWSGGRRTADCSNAGYSSVPTTLSQDIQSLILDGNPLKILPDDVFKSAGLLNLQQLSLKRASLTFIDSNAFRDLKIMRQIDLSHNNLTHLHPKTFDGNEGLSGLILRGNRIDTLVGYQFPPLNNLKSIDLSSCGLGKIERTAFRNLGGSVEDIKLDSNRLPFIADDVFAPLRNLKSLTLHSNPWKCDCRLKNFRDFAVHRRLYKTSITCNEPARLAGKKWEDVQPAEFACKPIIDTPIPRVFGSPGVDVELSCHVTGSPVPQVRWVLNGRIVNNNTHPAPMADQTFILREERLSSDAVRRWLNLTITNPTVDDLGEYLCVAENNGGVAERKVTLTFDDPSLYYDNDGSDWMKSMTDEQRTIIIGIALAIVFLLIILVVICCLYFKCHRIKSKKDKNRVPVNERQMGGFDSHKLLQQQHQQHNGTIVSGSIIGTSSNPLPKPPRNNVQDFHPHPHHIHNSRSYDILHHHHQHHAGKNSDPSSNSSTASSSGGENGNRPSTALSRASYIENEHYPDLLPKMMTVKSVQKSPESASSMSTLNPSGLMLTPQQQPQQQQQPYHHTFTRSGTLPLPHHYHGGSQRSVSLDHASIPVGIIHTPQGLRVTGLPVAVHVNARPGYVTLPRRPRQSWSVPRETPSPRGSVDREPIYDGIGPRTSADGSSKLNLNKSLTGGGQQPRFGGSKQLPPYCAPIEELAECPPTPNKRAQKSLPNILSDHNESSSSSIGGKKPSKNSLLTAASGSEENIEGYCEPFGPAELEEQEEKKKAAAANFNKKEIPPKTLPKPKVKPVPPPKPKKSFDNGNGGVETPPLISFQDECEDGSEV